MELRHAAVYGLRVSRALIDSAPRSFEELQGAHQSPQELEKARQVMNKHVPDADALVFRLWSVPIHELVESNFVEAILGNRIPADDYARWRRSGAPQAWLFGAYAEIMAYRREHVPEWAAEQAIIDGLTGVYTTGRMDPLIGARMESTLSTGEKAVFVIDGRHRLYAAIAAGVSSVEVYIGHGGAEPAV